MTPFSMLAARGASRPRVLVVEARGGRSGLGRGSTIRSSCPNALAARHGDGRLDRDRVDGAARPCGSCSHVRPLFDTGLRTASYYVPAAVWCETVVALRSRVGSVRSTAGTSVLEGRATRQERSTRQKGRGGSEESKSAHHHRADGGVGPRSRAHHRADGGTAGTAQAVKPPKVANMRPPSRRSTGASRSPSSATTSALRTSATSRSRGSSRRTRGSR